MCYVVESVKSLILKGNINKYYRSWMDKRKNIYYLSIIIVVLEVIKIIKITL